MAFFWNLQGIGDVINAVEDDQANPTTNPIIVCSKKLWVPGNGDFNPWIPNNDYSMGSGYFETIKEPQSAGRHCFNLIGHAEQWAASGDLVGIHGSAWKFSGGSVWAGLDIVERYNFPNAEQGYMHGREIDVQNYRNDFGNKDYPSGFWDDGLWIGTGGGANAFPLQAAIGIYGAVAGKTWYNGIWVASANAIMPNGSVINSVPAVPMWGWRFGNVQPGGAHFYNAVSPLHETIIKGGVFVFGTGPDYNSYTYIGRNSNGTLTFAIDNSGGGYLGSSGWYYASDLNLKKNVEYFDNGLEIINRLKPVKFDYKSGEEKQVGFIAQDVRNVLPESVRQEEGNLSFKQSDLIPYLVNAIKELSAEVNALKQKVH